MARQKATPLRREPSSEYTAGTPRNQEKINGDVITNGHANESPVTNALVPKEAGALQFLIAVGGIYGSLYRPLRPRLS